MPGNFVPSHSQTYTGTCTASPHTFLLNVAGEGATQHQDFRAPPGGHFHKIEVTGQVFTSPPKSLSVLGTQPEPDHRLGRTKELDEALRGSVQKW